MKASVAAKVANLACFIRDSEEWFSLRSEPANHPCIMCIPLTTAPHSALAQGLRRDLAAAAMVPPERLHVLIQEERNEDLNGTYAYVSVRPRVNPRSPTAHDVASRIVKEVSSLHGMLTDTACGSKVDFACMHAKPCDVVTAHRGIPDLRKCIAIGQRLAAAESAGLVQ